MNLIELLKEVTTAIERKMMYNFAKNKFVTIFAKQDGTYEVVKCSHMSWYCYGKYITLREAVDTYLEIINKNLRNGTYTKTYDSPTDSNLEILIEAI